MSTYSDLIYSKENKYIFIHIPKNAGTSLSVFLGHTVTPHLRTIDALKILGAREYSSCCVFCFVRNPYDRFLSNYYYARMEESYYHSANRPRKARYGKHLDYDLLSTASIETAAKLLHEGKLRHAEDGFHWKPQSYWVCDSQGLMIDRYFPLESIQSCWTDVQAIVKKEGTFPHLNISQPEKKDFNAVLSSHTINLLNDYYAEDFKHFGYQMI